MTPLKPTSTKLLEIFCDSFRQMSYWIQFPIWYSNYHERTSSFPHNFPFFVVLLYFFSFLHSVHFENSSTVLHHSLQLCCYLDCLRGRPTIKKNIRESIRCSWLISLAFPKILLYLFWNLFLPRKKIKSGKPKKVAFSITSGKSVGIKIWDSFCGMLELS